MRRQDHGQVKKPQFPNSQYQPAGELKVRVPKGKELIGKVISTLGAARMSVLCSDGKERVCRIPGRFRKMWIKESNIVLVVPWEIEGDEKGDIVYRYSPLEAEKLMKQGLLKGLE